MDIRAELKKNLSLKKLNEIDADLRKRHAAAQERRAAIGQGALGPGPVRAEVLQTGTDEDLRNLDDELRNLDVELARIKAQDKAVTQRRKAQAGKEAAASLPKQYETLVAHIDELERLNDALVAEWEKLADVYNGIEQSKSTARGNGHDAPSAPQGTLERFEAMRARVPSPVRNRATAIGGDMLSDALGADETKEVANG